MIKTDFLVIGSGLAGLLASLRLSETGEVTLITKRSLSDAATSLAQGGVACVTSADDDFRFHVKDTLVCGRGLSKKPIVEKVVRRAPAGIAELSELGVKFDLAPSAEKTDTGEPGVVCPRAELGLEGGHSRRRILHVGDKTGASIEAALIKAVLAASPRIRILENYAAIDLITKNKIERLSARRRGNVCYGAYALDVERGKVEEILASRTVLATGGAGKVYLYTSNPDVATGDGVAMAHRAGCRVSNMEFVQFHPTCLYYPGNKTLDGHSAARSFLISEALRGEGAVLTLKNGYKFMKDYHSAAELAPRDIVARAIDSELKKSGDDYVLLDISAKPSGFIKKRFPKIYEACLAVGIDITTRPIPVVPSAHYFCGGVVVDEHGATDVAGLYAVGETASTGLHGANRLASNSLLECAAFAHFASEKIKSGMTSSARLKCFPKVPRWDAGDASSSDESVVISQNWDEIRRFMWNYVGIVRSDKRLRRARERIGLIKKEINEYYWNFHVSRDIIELRNIAVVADLVVRSASSRLESRGLHYNIDHPKKSPAYRRDTVI